MLFSLVVSLLSATDYETLLALVSSHPTIRPTVMFAEYRRMNDFRLLRFVPLNYDVCQVQQ
jgi:hypothetical protein